MRKSKGLYDRIVKNLTTTRATGDFPAFIHTTLNALNYKEIARIVKVWAANGLADGIMVSTLTPIRDSGDESFRLSREQRIWIVDELVRIKKEFPRFVCMTEPMIRRLHPDHTSQFHPAICDTAKWIESYDAAGKRIPQCILSDKADCKECGCVVTTMSDGTQKASLRCMIETARTMSKLFTLR